MLRLTEIELNFPETVRVRSDMGSVFHGALMELIAPEAAERFHTMALRPYSQCVYWDKEKQKAMWRIGTLDEYAYEQLILPLKEKESLYFKQKGYAVGLEKMTTGKPLDPAELSKGMIQALEAPQGAQWTCLTTMSFKQNGRYVILPDARLLYQSLLNRWNAFYPELAMTDEGLLEQLSAHCRLARYELRSQMFSVEGSKIYGCYGSMEYRFFGFDMLKRLQGILSEFANYAGVGIKTALGMGAVQIKSR